MRSRQMLVAAVVAVIGLSQAGTVAAQEREVRTFDGTGSAGMDSPVELYLLEAEYEHRLSADGSCLVTLGVFPAERDQPVRVRDVLQADLAIGGAARAGPAGRFQITQAGWATVQVGTGPACSWTYEIEGPFLPVGREPRPPGSLTQPWILWAAVAVAMVLAARLGRKRSPARRSQPLDAEPRVTVLDTEDPD